MKRVAYFSGPVQDDNVDLTRRDRVPRFWANNTDDHALNTNFIMVGAGYILEESRGTSDEYRSKSMTDLRPSG